MPPQWLPLRTYAQVSPDAENSQFSHRGSAKATRFQKRSSPWHTTLLARGAGELLTTRVHSLVDGRATLCSHNMQTLGVIDLSATSIPFGWTWHCRATHVNSRRPLISSESAELALL